MPSIDQRFRRVAPHIINFVLGNNLLRKRAADYARRYIYDQIVEKDNSYTRNMRYEKYAILANLVGTVERALTNKSISASVRRKIVDVFVGRVFLKNKKADENKRIGDFVKEFGYEPPGFITISPGKRCNLQCTGCYAASAGVSTEKLGYETVSRIVTEKTQLWGSFFTVISGGEPLLWKSDGKGILDLCRDHPDNYFMMYTNGTLIDKAMAKKVADVGNLSPAISVEGLEAETDERRGAGTYRKVIQAMANLKEAGVPFGVSVTATKDNADKILTDEFIDFYFEKQGCVYGWIFQYMPIGRHQSLDLMVTPEQRRRMFEREKRVVHEKHVFFPDFWNGGVYSDGCLAAGRAGGYVYVDWNGNVSPCVFYPYAKNNINDIYARGGNVNEVLKSDLMVRIREWQRKYGFQKQGKEVGNFIMPCSIRDHYEFTHALIGETEPKPMDENAAEAVKDPAYYEGMVQYDQEFSELTEDVWQNEFIGNGNNNGSGNGSGDDERRRSEAPVRENKPNLSPL